MTEKSSIKPPQAPGYFAWVKSMKGVPVPEKFHEWRMSSVMAETKKHYESMTIAGPYPLSQDEWDHWNLDQLAAKYPCPPLPPPRKEKAP